MLKVYEVCFYFLLRFVCSWELQLGMRQGKTEAGPYAWEVHCSRRASNYDLSQLLCGGKT